MSKRDRERRKLQYSDARKIAKERDEGFVSKAFKIPEGMTQFRFRKEKVYKLDVIPYIVGKGNPNADEGTLHFELTYYVHRNVGPNRDTILCLNKCCDSKCFNCEEYMRQKADPESDEKLVKELKYKERQLFLLRDVDELEKGVQLFESSYYKGFGEMLDAKIKAGDDDYPFWKFYHLSGGFRLYVSAEEDTWEGGKFFKPTNIEMRPRTKDISESILDKVPCLEDLLTPTDYKRQKEMLLAAQTDDDDDTDSEEDERPTKGSSKKKKKSGSQSKTSDADEDDEEFKYKFAVGDRVKGKYKGSTFRGKVKKLVNGLIMIATDDDETRTMDQDDLTLLKKAKAKDDDEGEDDDGEDEAPKKSGKTSKSSSKKASDEDDEDDSDDEDEESDEDSSDDDDEEEQSDDDESESDSDEDEEDDDEDEDSDDEEDDEKPVKKDKKSKKKKKVDEEDDEDDIPFDDDEDDDE